MGAGLTYESYGVFIIMSSEVSETCGSSRRSLAPQHDYCKLEDVLLIGRGQGRCPRIDGWNICSDIASEWPTPPDGLATAMSCQQHTQYGLSKDPGPLSPCARRAWYCICPCRTSFHRTRTGRCTSYQQMRVSACGRKSSEPGLVGIGEEEGLRGCRWRTVPHCTVVNRAHASRPRLRSCQG